MATLVNITHTIAYQSHEGERIVKLTMKETTDLQKCEKGTIIELYLKRGETYIGFFMGIHNDEDVMFVHLTEDTGLSVKLDWIAYYLEEETGLKLEQISKIICDYYNITEADLKSKRRKRELVQARHIAMYFSTLFCQDSLTKIGVFFGGKSHCNAIYAKNHIEDLLLYDKRTKREVEALLKIINH